MTFAAEAALVAQRFLSARREARGLPDFPGTLPESLDQAYAIQEAALAEWNRPVIGWKVGRVFPPLAEHYRTDRLVGPIFASRPALAGEAPEMPVFAAGFAAAEAEFLLRIGASPPAEKTDFSLDDAAGLIEAVHVGIEIASSPLGAINAIGPAAIVSDFGNNNGLIVGPEIEDWRGSGFQDWTVTTFIDGVEIGTGKASAFPDGAIGSARFLFEHCARRGIALQAGQWISSGAVTGVHDVKPGQRVDARFNLDHSASCSIIAAQPD